MTTCPSCGTENPEGQKFCGECAAPLMAPARPIAEERKVVTALFCDLVGFTATSESADPEDVDQMLSAYAEMARSQIEGHGGVVEKFIGDAVVGIFGVPAAHEDDPERAVRAAIRIAEDAEALQAVDGAPLQLRVGINTGETLVRLGVSVGSGERMLAGDAINTASRIQSVAPQMGVAVGVDTYEATSQVFEYEELEPAELKGKAEPVRVFWAKSPRARLGTDITRTHDTPFIGREIDLALLKGIFDKTVAAASPQLVTVLGEPGLGKSRIVAELGDYIDRRPDMTTWRQGRCLPYGEGITFWALGEILKAHAGILESDPQSVAASKLDEILPEGDEKAWFRQRLLPLLGIEASSVAEREELFTAWRRFLEHVGERHPTVLVFEDLHWADAAMLAFLEHLADHAEGVPLLVVGTARPELFDRYPDYAAGLRNATPINLAPLTEDETARLVSALLETAVIPAELQQPILERAEGNPLYAEEFVRLLRDKELLHRKGSSWELVAGVEVPFPETVQALIAARLDTLGSEAKSMLADAAVIGKVFWADAVAQMGDRDPSHVAETFRELSRKELVRPARRSSIEGEAEHAFCHVLARDVAYGQLPRVSRAARHVAAARWIESKAPERAEDLADVLAYHYATALELAHAAGDDEQATELEAPALRFLTLAGERAMGLDTAAALTSFERALSLTPPGHPARPKALARYGEVVLDAGRYAEAAEALEEAIGSFRAREDIAAAAGAMGTLAVVQFHRGDAHWSDLPAQALSLLEPLGPSPELASALTEVARVEVLDGSPEAGLGYAERALELADQLRLPRPARALGYRGAARCSLGDRGGLDDYRSAINLAMDTGQGQEVARLHNNLASFLSTFEGPVATLEVARSGLAFAQARGLTETADWMRAGLLDQLFDVGEHEEALEIFSDLLDRFERDESVLGLLLIHAWRTWVLVFRGHAARVADSLDWFETTAREAGGIDFTVGGLAVTAVARAGLGSDDAAAALLAEIAANTEARENQFYASMLPEMTRTALRMGRLDLAERLVGGMEPRYPSGEHSLVAARAALAEAQGDLEGAEGAYAEAAVRWERFGVVPEHAFALLGQGRCLAGLSRLGEASPPLRRAYEIFEPLGAAALAETDSLLQQATALSS